jgi:signal transduction histidine kinase
MSSRAQGPPYAHFVPKRAGIGSRALGRWKWHRAGSWQLVVAGAAVAAAAVAVWVTATADFLAYPWWLAVQKADFVLGPVLIGLYWLRRRPASRFGPTLIGFGFVGAVYVLQSASNPWLFGAGLLWENVVGVAAYVLILTFPTGRLDGLASKLILLTAVVGAVLPAIVILLLLPQVGAGGSISGCSALCPENALAITSQPSLALDLWEVFRYVVIGVAVATAALLIWRLVTGTPPQRRAMAIGAPIALLFLSLQVTFHVLALIAPDATTSQRIVAWAFAGARAAIWYGFLAALIAAQLFAARALQRLVRESLRRPAWGELEAMLRRSLGDPRLRLAFWDSKSRAWSGPNGEEELRLQPNSGLDLKVIRDGGGPAVALVHDSQLNDDPELLQTAGAVALLAAENAELDREWNDAHEALRQSRDRIVRAGDRERRKLERNLHDGVQQRLVAIAIELGLARELAAGDDPTSTRLVGIQESVTEVVDELREISHGIYPPVLSDYGLVKALRRTRPPTGAVLTVRATDIGRHSPELESALYYCCLEAIQNATKHGGPAPRISVTLEKRADELTFQVSDEGPGFDASTLRHGTGFENMRDRIGALDGHLSIVSSPGAGTTVSGSVPLHPRAPANDPPRNGSLRQRTL